jgi:hypothetical protein
MRRRDLIARVGAAAALWPGYLFAQSGVAARIALLDPGESQRLAGFIGAMRDLGYVEGRNISYTAGEPRGGPKISGRSPPSWYRSSRM